MASPTSFPDIWGMLAALIISVVSATISISRRILGGHQFSILWLVSEFLSAILCGYLMYHTYPAVDPVLPDWMTLPVAVAVAAHSGGRIFQEIEAMMLERCSSLIKRHW
jgi:tellurite resistance protein TehA-like permease